MRVYQFRHIRAPVNSSRHATPTGMLHGNRRSDWRQPNMTRIFALLCALALCCLPAARPRGGDARRRRGGAATEVVVTLSSPPLAGGRRRRCTGRGRPANRHDSPLRCARAIPTARIRWRYRIVLNGAAVVVPRDAVSALRLFPA